MLTKVKCDSYNCYTEVCQKSPESCFNDRIHYSFKLTSIHKMTETISYKKCETATFMCCKTSFVIALLLFCAYFRITYWQELILLKPILSVGQRLLSQIMDWKTL